MLKYQNSPKSKASFLPFLRLKALFDYTCKLKKPEYPCGRKPKKRLSSRKKMRD
jgi:hypothetical protein